MQNVAEGEGGEDFVLFRGEGANGNGQHDQHKFAGKSGDDVCEEQAQYLQELRLCDLFPDGGEFLPDEV